MTATRPRPRPHTVVTPFDSSARSDDARWRLRHAAVCVVFTALCVNQDAGRLMPDTKLDLVVAPGRFLGRALTLWDGQGFAGQLQNQAYGYLFPMGPFLWVFHALGVPGWAIQRLWWSALLCVAYLGVVKLGRALGVGTPFTVLVAGVAYAASPHVLSLFSLNSIESLPMCVAPWVVLPLVRGASGGSTRRAGLLCGVAILFLGGVNAAADLAAVLPAALFLLAHRPSRRMVALAGWSVLGAALATFWWVVPLVLFGRYSPPFLDWIENANATTAVTSLTESLRGTADWVAYLPSSGWRAGELLLTQPLLILDTVAVAALGLAGVALTRSRHRIWLVLCLCCGLVLITLGHRATVGSAFAGTERSLLDTSLAPIRNIHKFDVLLRLPLVLGLADLLPGLRWGPTALDRLRTGWLVRAVAVVAVAGAVAPLITLQMASPKSSVAIPGYWHQTAAWLGVHAGNGRSLLVPASTTPAYLWGTPTDEPLQPLARSPWEVRNNAPLVDAGHIRVLDEIDRRFAVGARDDTLAAYLARTGIRYLVVRNDLDYRAVGSVAPAIVHATLVDSPGFSRTATFGPLLGGVGDYGYSVDQGQQPLSRAVEVWRVAGSGDPRVTATTSLTRLSGGPEDLSTGAAVLAGSPTGGVVTSKIEVTDSARRREVNFGGAAGQQSVTLQAGQDGPLGRRVQDYLPVAGANHQSVVRYLGAQTVTASSSAASTNGFSTIVPAAQPWSAFDDDASTSWLTAPGTSPVGQWVEVRYRSARLTPSVTVRLPGGSRVTGLSVRTDSGTVRLRPHDGVAAATLRGRTTTLRVTVTAVRRGTGQVGIADVRVPGVHLARTIVVPRDVPAGRPVDELSFATAGDARTGCVLVVNAPLCVDGRARGGEDGAGLDRTFSLSTPATYTPAVTVTPRAGPALEALIARAARFAVTASASSRAVPDPLAGPQSLVDGDVTTGWVADPSDPDPTVTLRWATPVRLASVQLVTDPTQPATRPDLVRIVAPSGSRSTLVQPDGIVRFAPLTTDRITLHLGSAEGLRPVVSGSIGPSQLGIGLEEILVPGVPATTRTASAATPMTLPCGTGPALVLDGRPVRTAIATTVDALRDLRPIAATVCDATTLDLGAGTHRLVAAGTGSFDVTAATLSRTDVPVLPTAAVGTHVTHWTNTARSVRVGARAGDAVLIVNENANAGWRATLGGRTLARVTVDGWRQGYVLPAGAAATVRLVFTPQHDYALALIVGAGAVLLLLVLAALAYRARPARRAANRWAAAQVWGRPVAVVAGVLTGGLVGSLAGLLAAAAATAVVLVLRRVVAVGPALSFAALLAAGCALALHPWESSNYAANTASLQLLCIVAVAAATACVARPGDGEQQ